MSEASTERDRLAELHYSTSVLRKYPTYRLSWMRCPVAFPNAFRITAGLLATNLALGIANTECYLTSLSNARNRESVRRVQLKRHANIYKCFTTYCFYFTLKHQLQDRKLSLKTPCSVHEVLFLVYTLQALEKHCRWQQ